MRDRVLAQRGSLLVERTFTQTVPPHDPARPRRTAAQNAGTRCQMRAPFCRMSNARSV
jgi:hypothetical protein